MKKVLALVLTLAMLVGSLAVGLSAAFEFTATENGDKFENVYSYDVTFENKAANAWLYTYVNGDVTPGSGAYELSFDILFAKEDGGFLTNHTFSEKHPVISPTSIGLYGQTMIAHEFSLHTWHAVKFVSDGSNTTISVDGTEVGTVASGLPTSGWGSNCSGSESSTYIDNFKIADTTVDFNNGKDGTFERVFGGFSGEIVNGYTVEVRRDLGKGYGSAAAEGYTFIKVGEDYNWKNSSDSFTIEFDINFIPDPATQCELEGSGNSPWVTNTKIGVNTNESGKYVNYNFKSDEWYHLKYVGTNNATEIYVDGVKVEGNFPAMDGGSIHKQGWYFWPEYIKMDNIKVGKTAAVDFENDQWGNVFEGCAFSKAEYVGTKVNIFDKISTYPVEGEATLVEACFNGDKNPSKDENALYTTTSHSSGAVPKNYIVNFDLALYPDKEGDISSDKTKNGAWIEFIVNKFNSGDDSRVKIGNKFVGKNRDLYYYGEDDNVKDIQPWAPGEFHNVTLEINNGQVVVYIDKAEVYVAAVGMDNWDDLFIWYFDNCNAIIDNYRVYDAKTFEEKVNSFKINTNEEYAKTISDIKAENFCEANGHIRSWARTADPKCYEKGVNTYKCWNCGATEDKAEVAMLKHEFEHYDIKRIEKVNDEDLVVSHCKTSAGCSERKYVKLPTAEEYQGELKFYHDFQDDFMKVNADVWGFDVIEDGVAKYTGADANYNHLRLGREYSSTELNDGFRIGFDFSVDGIYETSDTAKRGHVFNFEIGENMSGIGAAATIQYNMDDQRFSIYATNNNFSTVYSDAYPLVPGEVYNLEVAFAVNDDEYIGELSVYVNGQKVLYANEDNVWEYMMYMHSTDYILMHVFGVKFSMDNFVIGDYDFAWNRAYAGDVDGDYAITVADALLMRKYLAKIVDMDALYQSRADVNGDGYVDAIDQLRIRKALAE